MRPRCLDAGARGIAVVSTAGGAEDLVAVTTALRSAVAEGVSRVDRRPNPAEEAT
jgi:thiamine monophosphate synthase